MTDKPSFAQIDIDKIGSIRYGETPETLALPKPFIQLRVLEDTVYFQDGRVNHKGKIRLYIDPRGDSEFAIGIHPWMEDMLGSKRARQTYGDPGFGIVHDTIGNHYILAPTAKEVRAKFGEVQRAYVERLKVIGGKVYLGVFFSCRAPKFIQGVEQPVDPGIILGDERRRISKDVDLNLSYERGVLVNDKFYRLEEGGRIGSSYRMKGIQCVYLEDTPDNLRTVKAIVMALANVADMLDSLFDRDGKSFKEMIDKHMLPALPGPDQVQPTPPKRFTRTRR